MALGERPAVNYEKLIRSDRVHGRLYYDPEIFREEMDKIWHCGWVYVGHESEVPDPRRPSFACTVALSWYPRF